MTWWTLAGWCDEPGGAAAAQQHAAGARRRRRARGLALGRSGRADHIVHGRGRDLVGERGVLLSGGQKQRIAIARAFIKNAPIVILDEATAYIDAENEALIQEAMAKVIAGKTVLMIAHRLSTITDADKIVVIKDGQIIDEGTHENLLTSCTLYQEMWKAHMDTKDVA